MADAAASVAREPALASADAVVGAPQLVGCHDMLGGWNLEQGVGMQWQDGHVWTAQVPLDATQCEFKFVVASGCGQHVHWEALPENRSLRVSRAPT